MFDSDFVLERRLGVSVREYFEAQGEPAFREAEQQVLNELTEESRGVLSTGGGVVLKPGNRENLHARTCSVYLHCAPDELFKRLRRDRTRPLLQVADPLEKLKELYATRDPLYREVAHLVVQTGAQSIPSLVDLIVTELERLGSSSPSR